MSSARVTTTGRNTIVKYWRVSPWTGMRSAELERNDFILKTLHSTTDTCLVELEMTNIRINPEGLQWYLDKKVSDLRPISWCHGYNIPEGKYRHFTRYVRIAYLMDISKLLAMHNQMEAGESRRLSYQSSPVTATL